MNASKQKNVQNESRQGLGSQELADSWGVFGWFEDFFGCDDDSWVVWWGLFGSQSSTLCLLLCQSPCVLYTWLFFGCHPFCGSIFQNKKLDILRFFLFSGMWVFSFFSHFMCLVQSLALGSWPPFSSANRLKDEEKERLGKLQAGVVAGQGADGPAETQKPWLLGPSPPPFFSTEWAVCTWWNLVHQLSSLIDGALCLVPFGPICTQSQKTPRGQSLSLAQLVKENLKKHEENLVQRRQSEAGKADLEGLAVKPEGVTLSEGFRECWFASFEPKSQGCLDILPRSMIPNCTKKRTSITSLQSRHWCQQDSLLCQSLFPLLLHGKNTNKNHGKERFECGKSLATS